jgi:dipeptidyl aminopeptidase/acylaminoacyl peptidase
MKKYCVVMMILFVFTTLAFAQSKHPLTFDDVAAMHSLSDPQISPDGKWIAYTVTVTDKAANSSNSDIWMVSIDGKTTRQLTNSPKGDSQPRWRPDGKVLAFISSRDGVPQIYNLPMDGGEAAKLTNISTGASNPVWSNDGKWLLFSSSVYPECPDDSCNQKRTEEWETSKVKARIYDHLPYRHWNTWGDGTRSHIFVANARDGSFRDLTPGDDDAPTADLGGFPDYAFSPDGMEVCYVKNTDPVVAMSTYNDLFIVPVGGGEAKCITTNQGNDNNPAYSPDGKYIAYLMMPRAGFDSDRQELVLYDRASGAQRSLTVNFDRSVGNSVWAPTSDRLYFLCSDEAYESIYTVSIKGGDVKQLTSKTFNTEIQISSDGKTLAFLRQASHMPVEIWTMSVDGKNPHQLTFTNGERLAQIEMNPLEEFWFTGADSDKVQGLIIKPPQFDPKKKYPMIYQVHGGPQSAWSDNFSPWNSQLFAAPGYVVVMINFHGSTGYGQKFTDSITEDWGGRPYEDLMKGVDYVLRNYPFIDGNRMAATGLSYGGYMMYWFMGHTDRFKCIVAHAGVFNIESAIGSTDFPRVAEWEFGGTYWQKIDNYNKWSPHRFVKNWETPLLVIHGQKDYRVDLSEGLQAFTAAQLQGIPSKLVYFPDEGHAVSKPLNSEFWYKTVLDWIEKWTK